MKTAAPSPRARETRRLATALMFVGPNLLGFLAFTALPLILSFAMAFANVHYQRNNPLRAQQPELGVVPTQFVGMENFTQLAQEPRLLEYFGNTLFLMIGIPFNIAGSLLLATLLSRDLSVSVGGRTGPLWRRVQGRAIVAAVALFVLGMLMLLLAGAGGTAMTLLIVGLLGSILLLGLAGGSTIYRTLFYLPNFTAGVAVYMLWKRLYSVDGPVNKALAGPLDALTTWIRTTPAAPSVFKVAAIVLLLGLACVLWKALGMMARRWSDGELGRVPLVLACGVVAAPVVVLARVVAPWLGLLAGAAMLAVVIGLLLRRRFRPARLLEGLGGTLLFAAMFAVVELILVGVALACLHVPDWALAKTGLRPPDWLNTFTWAKPALMIMGFWAAVGSNNMLLYLAGISNVPQELYEAADIDGASRSQKFWNVTWPQLAPTTFFIVIMSVIGGLQGGFDAARVMTQGQAGTTTLTYFIFNKVAVEAAMSNAAAIAWILFALVFIVTLFNWKVGNQYVND